MNIAQIAYANTAPFFHFWPSAPFRLIPGVPRELARLAKEGEVVAGPLPLVETWALEKTFLPLGNWGIASRERCGSVLVFSRRPFNQLDNATVGLTTESSTSVMLCAALLRHRYDLVAHFRRGLEPNDDAWLVIGDQALTLAADRNQGGWPYVTDLATEWWSWKRLPFVFARWVVTRDFPPRDREALSATVGASMAKARAAASLVAATVAKRLNLSAAAMATYLSEFEYELTPEAELSIRIFRELAGAVPEHPAPLALAR